MFKKYPVTAEWSGRSCIFTRIIPILLLPLILTCVTPTVLVNKEQKLGDDYFNHFAYDEASKHYQAMLLASSKLGIYRNLTMEADVLRKLANCREMTGNYDQALVHVREAMKLDSVENNILGRIEDSRQEGKILIYSGRYQRGIKSLEKSLFLSEGMDQSLKNDQRLSIAETYLAIGQLYATTGKIPQAQSSINIAMKLFMQAGDRKGEMESLLTLGSVFQDLGDWELAIGFLEKSVTIAEELGLGTARQNQLLASLSSSIGAYENAVRFQTKAMEDADKRYISGQRVWTTIGMGDVYSDLGDLNRAARYYSRAAAIRDTLRINAAGLNASVDMRLGNLMSAERFFASEGSISGEAVSAMRIGEVMMRNNKPDSALLFLSRSLSLFRESANWQGQVFVQLLKGELLVDKGELKTAKILLDSVILEKDYPESNWLAHYHLGRLYEKSKQNDKAIASYRESISVIEKVRSNLTIDEFKSSFFSNKRDVYNRLIYLLLEQGNQAEAFMISEQAKARAFYDILAGRRINFKPSKSADLLLLEQEKRKELQKKYLLLQKGIAVSASNPASRGIEAGQSRAALDQLQTEYEEVLQKVKLTEPAYSVMVAAQPVGINEIQSGLDPQTVIISYWISDDAISAWLVSTNDVIKTSSNIRSSDLEALVEKTRKAIKSLNKNDTREGLSRLYSLLISPFENRLAGISNIVVVPNGSLHFLPFQALIDTRGNYLVQKYNLSYAPSAGVYKICRDREIKPGMKFLGTALGDLDIDNNIGLPGTEDELKRILPLFVDKQSAIGKQSTETFLKQNAVNCNLLHIATHGSFNFRHPLYSHLLFPPSETDDGKLNVFEVFELNLNASLVTLSACETGLGNLNGGDELTGLSRAFLYAGSSSVIVSLWAVADYPTAVLMTNFYRNMKTHPVNEALTLAQRDVIKLFPEPLYWSPFILIGNGSITLN